MSLPLTEAALEKYRTWYHRNPEKAAYAPGRVEVLGNHTDYNEGFVLSAAIDFGTLFLAAKNGTKGGAARCRIVAGDLMNERQFPLIGAKPFTDCSWPNYVMGVASGLHSAGILDEGFDGLFFGNVPIGSGLSSSAALEMSTGLALTSLAGHLVDGTHEQTVSKTERAGAGARAILDRVTLAKIGQRAEHDYVGAKTGLLDQISSLYGREHHLVRTDFRTLEVSTVAFGGDYLLLTCDTQTKHSLGESDYNERRAACEEAVAWLAPRLDHEVTALRDISSAELAEHSASMPGLSARRAAHVVGENERVTAGTALLPEGRMREFGELMYASHESSRRNFENSCIELDFLVDASRETGSVLGARLSGGGFGGSTVMLLAPGDVDAVVDTLQERYRKRFGAEFVPHVINVSRGARLIEP